MAIVHTFMRSEKLDIAQISEYIQERVAKRSSLQSIKFHVSAESLLDSSVTLLAANDPIFRSDRYASNA